MLSELVNDFKLEVFDLGTESFVMERGKFGLRMEGDLFAGA